MKYYVRTLMLMLLSVLLPCLGVFYITNQVIFAQYRESVRTSQLDRLRAISGSNQLIIESIEQGALRFAIDPTVRPLGELDYLDLWRQNHSYLLGLTRTMRTLTDFVNTNKLLDSVYLYIDGTDYIITSRDSVAKLENFADLNWMGKYEQIKTDRTASRMMPSRAINTGTQASDSFTGYGRSCLTYIYPIMLFTSTFQGALVFNIYEDNLLEMHTENSNDRDVAIFDHNGTLITGSADIDYPSILAQSGMEDIFSEGGPKSGYFFHPEDGERIQYTYFRSDDNRFVFISVQDMGDLMNKTTAFQATFVFFWVLLTPFVAFLIFFVSRILYSPVSKLARELSSSGVLDTGSEKDEWSTISRAVHELLREDRRLFSDRGREKLREATVLRILAGGSADDDEEAKELLPYPKNICILVAVDANDSAPSRDSNYDSRMRLLVRLVEDGLSSDGMRPTAIWYDEYVVAVILSFNMPDSIVDKTLKQKLMAIQPEAKVAMGQTVTVAVGRPGEISDVRQSFEQAKNVMQYRFHVGLENILFYDAIYEKTLYYNADERIKYIQHCINKGNKAEAVQSIRELANDIKAQEYVSFVYVSQILNQLVIALTQYAIDNEIRLEELLEDKMVVYRQLWKNHTLDEACEWICGILEALLDWKNVENAAGSRYMKRITAYVDQNYSEDITIDSIASYIGISYSYLRKLFKEATGSNLADYINDLRIQKAKQLLIETNYKIGTIAEMCGFNHERSFSRAFSQAEGMSPGKYKSLQKKGETTNDE